MRQMLSKYERGKAPFLNALPPFHLSYEYCSLSFLLRMEWLLVLVLQ